VILVLQRALADRPDVLGFQDRRHHRFKLFEFLKRA